MTFFFLDLGLADIGPSGFELHCPMANSWSELQQQGLPFC